MRHLSQVNGIAASRTPISWVVPAIIQGEDSFSGPTLRLLTSLVHALINRSETIVVQYIWCLGNPTKPRGVRGSIAASSLERQGVLPVRSLVLRCSKSRRTPRRRYPGPAWNVVTNTCIPPRWGLKVASLSRTKNGETATLRCPQPFWSRSSCFTAFFPLGGKVSR
ncbi:hypothetical protein BT67DRAFT_132963 [Trichocladium antarcticum]|uniref:Uncharacterized protein n=1 Tax=Trichocladium antarcticum TaxID=1450529 RepID=A0AAN6UFN8_9PEZI|nr:hypothetical protein BT67DRAFT_132963 [Trichocladium antarcticum]